VGVAESFYALIKVSPDAAPEDVEDAIRSEYNKWARRASNAPRPADRHEAGQRVEELSTVKTVLTNPDRRAEYDRSIGLRPDERRFEQLVDSGWPPDPPPVPPGWPPDPPPVPPRQPTEGAITALLGVLGDLLRGGRPRRPRTWGPWRGRIQHRVRTAFLVLLAFGFFASAGGPSNPPVPSVIAGVILLAVAARVSGIWKRK
jgi:hypothetical protein